MKLQITLVLSCLMFAITTYGTQQESMPVHYIDPEPTDLLNANAIKILKSRTISFLASHGISGDGVNHFPFSSTNLI